MDSSNYKHVHLLNVFREFHTDLKSRPYGIDNSSPTPLTFDRASEGRPFTSDFILARLPLEITWQIAQLISEADLANLALVNIDCRQIDLGSLPPYPLIIVKKLLICSRFSTKKVKRGS